MKKWLYLSVISFLLSSLTIWFIPYEAFSVILGIVFWIGLIAGFLFLLPISKARKTDSKYTIKRIAFFRFFTNKPAVIFDILLVISLVITVITFIVPNFPQILSFGGVFGFVFSLEMHGIFNGRNYMYLKK